MILVSGFKDPRQRKHCPKDTGRKIPMTIQENHHTTLLAGDHPGAQIVADKLKGEDNCVTWANSMKLSLVSRKKTEFINCKVKKPLDEA